MDEAHPDQIKRETIPTVESLGTDYRPVGNFLMIAPLPEPEKIGEIILPQRARMQQCEGHVVAVGDGVPKEMFEVGDFVCWGQHHEVRMEVDGGKPFVMLNYSGVIAIIKKARLEESRAKRTAIST